MQKKHFSSCSLRKNEANEQSQTGQWMKDAAFLVPIEEQCKTADFYVIWYWRRCVADVEIEERIENLQAQMF